MFRQSNICYINRVIINHFPHVFVFTVKNKTHGSLKIQNEKRFERAMNMQIYTIRLTYPTLVVAEEVVDVIVAL